MKRTPLLMLACIGLGLASCGSDSDSGLSDAQSQAADMAIESAAEDGVTLEAGCVEEVAAQLSDEDAELIAADRTDEVSEEADDLSLDLLSCAEDEAITDLFIEGMETSGDAFDESCVRDALEDFDIAEITAAVQDGETPAELVAALAPCMELSE